MPDITDFVMRYREAARHVWNTSFRAGTVDWDTRDRFSRVATELFTALVLEPMGVTEQRLPELWESSPHCFHRIAVMPSSERIPILISRDPIPTGYWDHPVRMLERDAADMRFVQFFDWDELAYRDFNYAQVQIVRSPEHSELVGRLALLEIGHVRFHLLDGAA